MRLLGAALLTVFLCACGGREVLTKPDLALTRQPTLEVRPPINLIVTDDQAAERGSGYADQLSKSIRDAYPQAVISLPTDAAPASGQVTIAIHVRQLGAFFTNERGSVLNKAGGIAPARGTPTGWEPVMAQIAKYPSKIAGTQFIYLPGNWSGIAYMEVDVRDRRPGRTAAFSFPLAAERASGNDLGYLRAQMLASDAWGEVSKPLSVFLDAAVRKIASEGTNAAGQ